MRVDLCRNPRIFRPDEVRRMIPALQDLLRRYDVRGAYLFGSVLEQRAGPMSDLDIAVLPPPTLDDWLAYYSDLYEALCRLFRADNIDLVMLHQAPLSLQARIVLEGLCVLREDGTAAWEEQVLVRYADLGEWRRENWETIRRLALLGVSKDIRMIDRARVERFVFLIRDAVRELRALRLDEMGLEKYREDKHTRALSEHYLRIAIEATLDLGRHVIVKTGLGVPQEYRDVGRILWEKGIVPADIGQKLQRMAGMRNVLVHLYWDIDYERIYRMVVEELDTFERCVQSIFQYLERQQEDV
ncbi:MAG: type VII toxin-antitoxin system HepT family RNase toxin [Anaerolineae bacterium]